MAKERMVTRTVKITKGEVLCLNVVTAEPEINTYAFTGVFKTNEAFLKMAKKHHETEELKLVSVNTLQTLEKLYGMTELQFIQVAKPLDNRFAKIED